MESKISVRIKLYSQLKEIAGQSNFEITLDEKDDVEGLIEELCKMYGSEFRETIYDEDKNLQVNCLLNGKFASLNTEINDGDRIAFLVVAGGG